ncbi:MAG: hypothetical protein IH865_10110 [Chloroflexi bacterium]|nr:hypothetical protein [Chloroflexota bacterium]
MMNIKAIIRDLVPGKRWLAFAAAVALAASLITPVLASTLSVWFVGTQVGGVATDPTGRVWIQVLGKDGLRMLAPGTNYETLTTYTNASVSHSTKRPFADSTGDIWTIGTVPGVSTVQVISRFDPTSQVITSWPSGFVADSIAAGSAGDGWFADFGTTSISKVEPGTNTVTTWALPFTVRDVGGVDASNRAWFSYFNVGASEWGLARLDPVANEVLTWPVSGGTDVVFRPVLDSAGNVWAALARVFEDSIIQLDPVTNDLTEYRCAPGCDLLRDVAVDASGKVWFTEDVGPENGVDRIGRLDPAGPSFTQWDVGCNKLGLTNSCTSNAGFSPLPRSIAVDSAGNGWVSFLNNDNNIKVRIARITP